MGDRRKRVLVLGGGEAMDRVAAGLVAEGLAVSQVLAPEDAQRLLGKGGFDLVLADGARAEPGAALFRPAGPLPWLVLVPEGQAPHPAYEGAARLTLPAAAGRVAAAVAEAVAAAQPPAGRATRAGASDVAPILPKRKTGEGPRPRT
ncbi:MAG: hypothetical protein HZA24_07160 [Nitrospirae bacterium]|nr:hypothetical protein [Nitrospirota bacterium]